MLLSSLRLLRRGISDHVWLSKAVHHESFVAVKKIVITA